MTVGEGRAVAVRVASGVPRLTSGVGETGAGPEVTGAEHATNIETTTRGRSLMATAVTTVGVVTRTSRHC